MTLATFAEQHKLKVKKDNCGAAIIPGKHGELYQYNDIDLGVMFTPPHTEAEPWGRWCPKTWGSFKRTASAAGMTLLQDGDSDGCLSFDPNNREQAKLAIRIAKVRPKRQRSPEQVARFVAAVQDARLKALNSLQTGVLEA